MATTNNNALELLGAHVRGQYVIDNDDFQLRMSFDGIVESVVVNLDPSLPPEFFIAGDFHDLNKCTSFEVIKPSKVVPIFGDLH